jgi:transposase
MKVYNKMKWALGILLVFIIVLITNLTWTGPILIEWIKSQFDIVFKKAQIYNILRKNGFSYQKARGFYPEADLEKQEVFKDTLKKTSSE